MEGKDDLVSIIIPTYNSSSTLDRCIRCVVEQTYPNWEILIVDSDSTDATNEVALRWREKLGRRLRIHNIGRCPPAVARNYGTKVAQGEWLLHLDSDHYMRPRVLEECMERARQGYEGVVVPELPLFENKKMLKKKRYLTRCYAYFWWILDSPRYIRPIGLRISFVKRDCQMNLGGFDEDMDFVEDGEFAYKIRMAGVQVPKISELMIHDSSDVSLRSIVRRTLRSSPAKRRLIEKWGEKMPKGAFRHDYSVIIKRASNFFLKKPLYWPGIIGIGVTKILTTVIAMGLRTQKTLKSTALS